MADSTFKRIPSLCSILTAREVPSEGGNTEFVSTRAAYEAQTEEERRELDSLTVEHDFSVSRGRVGFKFSPEEAAIYPPVRHPLVQTNPVTGRRSLLIGAHAAAIVGWPAEKGAALLADLLDPPLFTLAEEEPQSGDPGEYQQDDRHDVTRLHGEPPGGV